MQRIPNIDGGEAILLAILYKTDNSLFATGDKRALQAMSGNLDDNVIRILKGRIICLEQLLNFLMTAIGYSDWLASIARAPSIDASVRIICGSRCDASKESILEGLKSYTSSLHEAAGGLLLST